MIRRKFSLRCGCAEFGVRTEKSEPKITTDQNFLHVQNHFRKKVKAVKIPPNIPKTPTMYFQLFSIHDLKLPFFPPNIISISGSPI